MKKNLKKFLAILMALLVVTATFPLFALAEGNDIERNFNIFLDAGEISDEYIAATTALSQSNWSDDYFSMITMTLGEPKLSVDGQEIETSCPPTVDNDNKLVLPVLELAQAVGAEAEIDAQTGDITIETDEGTVNLDDIMVESASVNTYLNSDMVQDVIVDKNNTITMQMADGSTITKTPTILEEQAEELLYLNVCLDGNKVIITKPYQTKEIILFVKDGKTLQNNYQAKEFVTNNQGLYFLQYESENLTKIAYETFKRDSSIQYVILNEINVLTEIPSPGNWGTDGNDYSMGIQAERMKGHLQNNNEEIIVAVVDSGIDSEYLPGTANGRTGHHHLKGRTTVPTSEDDDTAGYNFVGTKGDYGLTVTNNNPFDDNGHGTHVAGIIADCTPGNVKLLPIKSFNGLSIGTTANIQYGLNYAINNGSTVVNMSFGGSCLSEEDCIHKAAIEASISKAQEAGKNPAIFIAASGNEGIDTEHQCPARLSTQFDNVITVGAVDENDLPGDFSNYGDAVDVCAPGVNIYSSLPNDKYGTKSGTSMAAPHVSAAVAMLLLEYPNYTSAQIKTLLKNMTVDLGEPGWDSVFGSGRIDFRMLDSTSLPQITPISATDFTLNQIYDLSVASAEPFVKISNHLDETVVSAVVIPKDATDKSVSYSISDKNVAIYQNSRVIAKLPGTATITATKTGLSPRTTTILIEDNWLYHAASSFAGGTGTQNNPYLISTAEQLAKISYDSKYNSNYFKSKYFKLTTDINLQGSYWTPIKEFLGVFNGNGHSITNMEINSSERFEGLFGTYYEYSGLFAKIHNPGKIENLAVLNAKLNAGKFVDGGYGLLCGLASNVEILNCYTTGSIQHGAGMVGDFCNGSVMRNCYTVVEDSLYGLVFQNNYSHIYNSYSAGNSSSAAFLDKQTDSNTQVASIVNSFSVITSPSKIGFIDNKSGGSIQNCYYLSNNSWGVKSDSNLATTNLNRKSIDFFTEQFSFTTDSNWDSTSPWDFESVWAMAENGLPYLQMFPYDQVTEITVQPTLRLAKGREKQLPVTVFPYNATNKSLSWSSSNTDVATVNQRGIITPIDIGTVTITMTALDGSNKHATCIVTIDDFIPVDSITINRPPKNTLLLGDNDFPLATAAPSNAENLDIEWISNNPDVISISSTGFITAVGYGTATVTATATDGYGASASCTYTVSDDYGNTINDARWVSEHTEYNGTIELASDVDYFEFSPSTSGTYLFYTKGSLDTKGVLYDSNGTQLASNDDWDGAKNRNFGIKYTLAADQTYYIKVSAYSSAATGAYTFVIDDDHGNIAAIGTTVSLHSKTTGSIGTSGDVDYFKFIPSATGNYLFYTTGSTDTKGILYDASEMELVQNDDASIEGTNFAFKYSLTAGQTYYIKVSAYGTKTGSYALIVSKDLYSASLTGTNQDARKVGMKAEAASVLTTLQVKIGSKSYTLTKPTSGNLDTTVNGARFKVTFTSANNGLSTIWSITAKFPATAKGTTETVSFIFSKGKVTNVKSADINGFMAYRSSIKTGVDARASGNLQKLLTSMNNTGYTLSVHNWDDTPITVSSTTKASTGMKIVQKDSSGRITEVYYVVLFGDVAGTGVVGDGLINATDSMNVLKQLKDSMTLGAISQLAADANHDGSITTADSDLILNHAVGKATINQNYTITTVPDECYFQNPVVF